jgi:plastocyanin
MPGMVQSMSRWIALLALVVCGCGQPEQSQGTRRVDPATVGKVSGVVTFRGPVPPPRVLNMATGECAALHKDAVTVTDVLVTDGRLANAFVWVKKGLEDYRFEVPKREVELDQVGCMFVPRVLGLMVGQTLRMKNSDATMHNVHSHPQENGIYNKGFPRQGDVETTWFAAPEVMIPLKCDMHGWMTAYAGVTAHPFHAVTGADGSFAFEGLPPGDYVIGAWHESLKTVEVKVTLGAKDAKTVELSF